MLWEVRGTMNGKPFRGKIDASDEAQARQKAAAKGLAVSLVKPFVEPAASASAFAAPLPAPAAAAVAPVPQIVQVMMPAASGKSVSGLGIAALVLGIIGTVAFCVPFVSLPLAGIGLVLGGVGLLVAITGKRHGLAFPIAGVILSIVPFVIWGVVAAGVVGVGAAGATAAKKAIDEQNAKMAAEARQRATQPATQP